jgi:hypothetical protein
VFFYQSYSGEPDERPLEMGEIEARDDVWRFALRTHGFSGRYELRMFDDHALLKRVDIKSRWVNLTARNGAMDDPVKLPRQSTDTSK